MKQTSTSRRKLSLEKQTLRNLSPEQLVQVIGGARGGGSCYCSQRVGGE